MSDPFEPMGGYLRSRGIDWTYYHDNASFRLLDEQPKHGCDLCSRYRRRAVRASAAPDSSSAATRL